MLKIGDFSKLAHVTVKALHHYARMGLLLPAWIDRYSGYRYYSLEQLSRLNRILALKDLGFSLDQISGLLDENVSVGQLREMLRRKQVELEAHLKAESERLNMVAARLQQIEQEGRWTGSEVLIKHAAAVPFASLRHTVPEARHTAAFIEQLSGELNIWLDRTHIDPAGPWMALYPATDYRERNIPLEVGVTIEAEVLKRNFKPDKTEVLLRLLPPVEAAACLVHTGPVETLSQTYTGLYAWIEANRMRVCGPAREVYLRDAGIRDEGMRDEVDKTEAQKYSQVIEVQLPVEKPGAVTSFNKNEPIRETPMKPTFVTKPAFNIVGMCYHGDNKNQEISAMWGRFLERLSDIERINPTISYGFCDMIAGLPEGHFEYVAGVEVAEGAPIPEGMVLRQIPAQKYAVFTHTGSLSGLSQTFQNLVTTWLPEAGLKQSVPFDMEVYTEEFDPDSPNSVLYLYTPIG